MPMPTPTQRNRLASEASVGRRYARSYAATLRRCSRALTRGGQGWVGCRTQSSWPASARPALRRTHLLATRSELEALTVPVLKDRLRSLSLKVGGKKGELVERLLASEQDANCAEAEPVVVDGVRVIDVGSCWLPRPRVWGR